VQLQPVLWFHTMFELLCLDGSIQYVYLLCLDGCIQNLTYFSLMLPLCAFIWTPIHKILASAKTRWHCRSSRGVQKSWRTWRYLRRQAGNRQVIIDCAMDRMHYSGDYLHRTLLTPDTLHTIHHSHYTMHTIRITYTVIPNYTHQLIIRIP
jgi:hypothetical protein